MRRQSQSKASNCENLPRKKQASSTTTPSSVPSVGEQESTNPSAENGQGDEHNQESDETVLARLKVKERSGIWHHYTRKRLENGRIKGVCPYCAKEYYANTEGNGTKNLYNHMDKCLKYLPNIEKMIPAGLKFFVPKKDMKELEVIGPCMSNDLTRLPAKHIILDELPFNFVEGIGFMRMMKKALPYWHLPCRKKMAKEVLKVYLEEKAKLKIVLKGRRVCLTTDLWTSLQNISYMVVICHFIDEVWVLHKRVLNFCPIQDHKGETIAAVLEDCLVEWEIEKVLTITVDNVSTNDVAIMELTKRLGNWKRPYVMLEWGKNMHMRCMAHILNLIVGDGLLPMSAHIEAICSSLRYVISSSNRTDSFKKCVERVKLECKGLVILDVTTRWNSTFLMLKYALKFEEAFSCLEVYVEFLKPFYEVTLNVCCSKSPTIHQVVGDLIRILGVLQDQCSHPTSLEMVGIDLPMEYKYKKYWGEMNDINQYMFVALILYPRYKCEKLVDYLEAVFVDNLDNEKVNSVMKGVKQCLTTIYNVYMEESGIERDDIQEEHVDLNDPSLFVGLLNLERTMKIKELKRTTMKKGVICNDLDRYMNDPVEKGGEKFVLLDWWKVNGISKYPILSCVARDILAIPISTISSESSFSTSGRIINPHRCSLSARMVEALICTKSWPKGEVVALDHLPTIEEMELYGEAERETLNCVESSGSMLPPTR